MSHAQPSGFTPLIGHIGTCGLVVALTSVARAQCPTPACASGCTTVCEVDTQAELVAALCCHAAAGTCCSHIRIPASAVLEVNSTFFLSNDHGGLHIEIIGTIEFIGTPHPDALLFDVNGTDDLTFDGGGTITNTADPYAQPDFQTARTFRFRNQTSDLTIENLNVTRMTDLVKVDQLGSGGGGP